MAEPPTLTGATMRTAIADAVSRLYLDNFGKGPLHAECFTQDDVVIAVLRDVFTAAEKAMIAGGRADNVMTTRMLWQHATQDQFRSTIEGLTSRRVLTVISGSALEDDVATEVFILAPS